MSPIAPLGLSHTFQAATKKGKNRKKKSTDKPKTKGDVSNSQNSERATELDDVDGDVEIEESESPSMATPTEIQSFELLGESQLNGRKMSQPTNGRPSTLVDVSEGSVRSNASDTTDTSSRLEAMSQDREALRAEVERLRRSLEDLRGRHAEDISAVRVELEESEAARDQAQKQYQNLLGRVNTIKSTLGERMAADRQELAEAKDQIDELAAQNESLKASTEGMQTEVSKLTADLEETSRELSSLRNRHNLSQQNWLSEREDFMQQTKHLKEEAEAAKEAMGDWEVLAMEERSIREGLADRVAELEDQVSTQKEAYERAASERDNQSHTVEGLQRALQEIQEARRAELREMVETSQAQLDALNKVVQEAGTRATDAEAAREDLTRELERLMPFEAEVKEKNLLIGKLRHEAIILNDHLTKALRFLKKAKPEDNIDRQVHIFVSNRPNTYFIRQIVTNYFLHFLSLDRSDPKKFEILQYIAALLNWTPEQKEQAGLARPGASNSSLRLPKSPFYRTPSTPSLSSEFFPDSSNKESLAELWTGFLERQAEEGRKPDSRSGSISGVPTNPRPDNRE